MNNDFQEFPQSIRSFYLRLKNPFFGVVFALTFFMLFVQLKIIGLPLLVSLLVSAALFLALLFLIHIVVGQRSIRVYSSFIVVYKRGREIIFLPEKINFVLLRKIFGVEMLTLKTFSKVKYEVTESYENYSELRKTILEFAQRNNVKVKEHDY